MPARSLKSAALFLALSALSAQEPTLFRTDSRLVVLHATAEDKEGRLVMDLPKTAFQVYENGVLQEIKSFRKEDVPVSLGLFIDNSASIPDKPPRVAAPPLATLHHTNPTAHASSLP